MLFSVIFHFKPDRISISLNLVEDMTDVAIEWAERNIKDNPHISELIQIRKVESGESTHLVEDPLNEKSGGSESKVDLTEPMSSEGNLPSSSINLDADTNKSYYGPPILLGVVKDGEKFDFCMCNPPFFESMEEAGLNPKTSCGGTPEEMVCPGGEKAFISRIIEDSSVLKQTFRYYLFYVQVCSCVLVGFEFGLMFLAFDYRWYTTMVGRKSNLKFLISKLREVGVSIVKTTEFVQGQTCRWGLAWSFVPPVRKMIPANVVKNSNPSFMLEVWMCVFNFIGRFIMFSKLKRSSICVS